MSEVIIGVDLATGKVTTYVTHYSVNSRGEVVKVIQEETLS